MTSAGLRNRSCGVRGPVKARDHLAVAARDGGKFLGQPQSARGHRPAHDDADGRAVPGPRPQVQESIKLPTAPE